MPKIQKKKIEQCTKIFIYRDLKEKEKFTALQLKRRQLYSVYGQIKKNAHVILFTHGRA